MPEEIYRSAASVLLLRPSSDPAKSPYQLLLLHKPRKNDAWQLPQGGMEAGETLRDAALRELFEEAGLRGVEVLGESATVYQYDFPPAYRRFRPDHVRGQRIGYVLALAPDGAEARVDGTEVDRAVWAAPGDLRLYVRRAQYIDIVRDLFAEAETLLSRRSPA